MESDARGSDRRSPPIAGLLRNCHSPEREAECTIKPQALGIYRINALSRNPIKYHQVIKPSRRALRRDVRLLVAVADHASPWRSYIGLRARSQLGRLD